MRCVVFFSGAGSTVLSLLEVENSYDYSINLLVTDNPVAEGINYANSYNKEIIIHPYAETKNNDEWCTNIIGILDAHNFELIVLAGFMRILSASFVAHYENRIINIHPSLLPKYKGLNTHSRVLEANEKKHGFTIHIVSKKLDDGQILEQYELAIQPQDTQSSLKQRVQVEEKKYYPQVLHSIANGEYDCVDTSYTKK